MASVAAVARRRAPAAARSCTDLAGAEEGEGWGRAEGGRGFWRVRGLQRSAGEGARRPGALPCRRGLALPSTEQLGSAGRKRQTSLLGWAVAQLSGPSPVGDR